MAALKLPRLPRGWQEAPDLFPRYWDEAMKQVESSVNGILAIPAIAAALAALEVATDAATAAAETATEVAALTNSGTTGLTITATDAGANVTVTLSAHTRIYGDGNNKTVNAGSVTGLAYSTLYYIYYDDATRAGGAVTYLATTSQTTAAQTGSRHFIGQVMTPAAAAPPTDGDYVGAPGLGNIYL